MVSQSNPVFVPQAEEHDFLPPLGNWITVGGIVALVTVTIAIAVASVTKYKVTVQAQANLRPAGELRLVQAATEGPVVRIFVKENQVVKTGDAIATIDDSRLQTKKSQLESSIGQIKLQLVQINAQIDALNNQIVAQTDSSKRAVAAAEAELSGRKRDYQDKQITTVSDVQEASANVKAATASLGAAESKRNRYENVAKAGALSQDQFEEAQLAVRQQEQALSAAKAKLQSLQAALNPTQAQIAIASQRIAQEKATGQANIATLNKERNALIQQRIEMQTKFEHDGRELKQVNVELKETIISATADGVISKLNLRNPGQTLRPGEEIAQIVPTSAPLVIKAVVGTEDKNKLKPGQNVQMRVSACPYPDYGTLKGKVKSISPDAFFPPANNGAATGAPTIATAPKGTTAFYEVTIEPEGLSLGRKTRQCSIQMGMEGRADIISKEETILQFFLRKARLIVDV
ncbi:HlyD family efflux transporter periplasmic adaptor subunit [Nostoc cf. edaphicum LEGE 07299]|uniref:HlyD family efflux transporter periplasmic adaptor subunit n=1 Tax=Nostoc cf. edaphicum LEGE 07299 TaxID=2777974 RepID=A0ABR9TZ60_9NOSO|nr:HlyD family efflux transporter periplasmic adaptor subunit [Nostoc edaphicum]MBE9105689.1 HlyD family efflux transporter periplasmic adaptor subunit [Nostoc cf. edaphicum LEGE 07299]